VVQCAQVCLHQSKGPLKQVIRQLAGSITQIFNRTATGTQERTSYEATEKGKERGREEKKKERKTQWHFPTVVGRCLTHPHAAKKKEEK